MMKKRPGGGFGNMSMMLKQAQKMQAKVNQVQEDIAAKEFDVSVGGGAVEVKLKGTKEILAINIKPEVVDPQDVETLQDLIMAAVNQGMKDIEDYGNEEMKKVTGGISIPGLF